MTEGASLKMVFAPKERMPFRAWAMLFFTQSKQDVKGYAWLEDSAKRIGLQRRTSKRFFTKKASVF